MANKVELRISWFAHTWFSPEWLFEEMSDPSRWILDGRRWWPFDEREKGLLGKLHHSRKLPRFCPFLGLGFRIWFCQKCIRRKHYNLYPRRNSVLLHATSHKKVELSEVICHLPGLAVYGYLRCLIRRLLIWSPCIRWFFQKSGFDAWRRHVAFRVGKALMTVWSVSYGYRNTRIAWNCQDPSGLVSYDDGFPFQWMEYLEYVARIW